MMVVSVQEGIKPSYEKHLRSDSEDRSTNTGITTLTVDVPFPAGIHAKLAVSCMANGWTVEQWCQQQVLERLELLQRDDTLRWETFFERIYDTAVNSWRLSTGEAVSPAPARDNLVMERLALLRALLQEAKQKPSAVVVVTFPLPVTTAFHGLLSRLCSFIDLTAEEWCSSVIFDTVYFAMEAPDLFCKLFTDDLEDRFCDSDITPLPVGSGRLE